MTKRCARCREYVPLEDFTRNKSRPDGFDVYCKPCRRARNVERREQLSAWGATYRASNRAKIQERKAVSYAKHRQRIRAAVDVRRFGITDRDRYVVTQGSACAICATVEPGGRYNRWAIDHDRSCCPGHRSCGRCVRGILCHRCNPGIGLLDEDPDLLHAAAIHVLKRRDILGEMLTRVG